MDFLDRIGDWFTVFTGWIERFITAVCSARPTAAVSANSALTGTNRRGTSKVIPGSILDRINSQEAEWQKLSDEELKQTATKFRKRLAAGETLDDLLVEAFAVCREAGRRFLGMRHYDVQLMGGMLPAQRE